LSGFEHDTSETVLAEALGDVNKLAARLDNTTSAAIALVGVPEGLQRLADLPIYAADPLVRRAAALQATADAKAPTAGLPTALWQQLGLQPGDKVRVSQGAATAVLPARHDATLAGGTVRVPAGHVDTASLGAAFGDIAVEKA
jgi:NADH-quinone oxidoreductase subunit G